MARVLSVSEVMEALAELNSFIGSIYSVHPQNSMLQSNLLCWYEKRRPLGREQSLKTRSESSTQTKIVSTLI